MVMTQATSVVEKARQSLRPHFERIDARTQHHVRRVLDAFRECRVGSSELNGGLDGSVHTAPSLQTHPSTLFARAHVLYLKVCPRRPWAGGDRRSSGKADGGRGCMRAQPILLWHPRHCVRTFWCAAAGGHASCRQRRPVRHPRRGVRARKLWKLKPPSFTLCALITSFFPFATAATTTTTHPRCVRGPQPSLIAHSS